ncbi:MAG: polysaccharide deacetylase family protein [Bacteroidetes bacterium]|nr:MAG: polysaccharide deacetylase family protein [Bacteroidota bacterium]
MVYSISSSGQPTIPYANQSFNNCIFRFGGFERMDTTKKQIYLCFTGHEFNDGGTIIRKSLKQQNTQAHFFFTGDFYRIKSNKKLIRKLLKDGHYLGAHSDKHLLYASWEDRDALLINQKEFEEDLTNNYLEMVRFGIEKKDAPFYMPPYEWYNQQISDWTRELGLLLVNFTPGTRSNADYTTPDMGSRYISSQQIFENIINYERESTYGLNGFILLVHIGTHPDRTDKLYNKLPELIKVLKTLGYQFSLMTDY